MAPPIRFSANAKPIQRDDSDAQRGENPITENDRERNRSRLMRYSGMGFEFAGGMIGLVLVGMLIDWKFATGPWGVVVGAGLGVVGGMYNFIRQAQQMLQDDAGYAKRKKREESDEQSNP